MAQTIKPKPVGQRPRCLSCTKELKPNYKREAPPFTVPTGDMIKVRRSSSYGSSTPEYEEIPDNRTLTKAERKQWRKEHPPVFTGTYGRYNDSRFCGLNCGHSWAVQHTKPVPESARIKREEP